MDGIPGHLSPKTLSLHEAAQQLGVSDKTLRRWIKAEKIPAQQEKGPYGVAWRIPHTAIQTAQQVIDVVPVDRSIDPRTLGLIIAQAVVQETRPLAETIESLQEKIERLTLTLDQMAQRQSQDPAARDAHVVHLIREALEQHRETAAKPRHWWPWSR